MGGASSLEETGDYEADEVEGLEGFSVPSEHERLQSLSALLNGFDGDGSTALALLGLNPYDGSCHGFIPTAALQPATQRLIDRLGCRQPATLQRVSAVYASVAGREGARGFFLHCHRFAVAQFSVSTRSTIPRTSRPPPHA